MTFQSPDGPRAGVRAGADVVDLSAASGGELPPDVPALLARGPDALAAAAELAATADAAHRRPLAELELLAPVPRPGKVFALAQNYDDHIAEGGGTALPTDGRVPLVFAKLTSSVIGPGAPIVLPAVSDTVDWELELGVVIGRRAKGVAAADAAGVVAGYVVANDVSARTMTYPGRTENGPTEDWFDFINGKWCDTFAVLGPYLVTADAVDDPHELPMRLRINGEVRQDGSTAAMRFRIPETIEFISRWATLEPGDVILTGTPAGTGAASDTYLRPGDVVEGTIGHLGTLSNPVVAE